jgi:cardiolipin synthase (CMP-forming)
MTIPNLITIVRIILAPIFVIYLIQERFTPALLVFLMAALTDAADGFVARIFNQKSSLGAVMDPLADKILLISAFVVLAARGLLPPWLTVLVISRDVLILLGALILFLYQNRIEVRPSVLSKLNTCFQIATVSATLAKGYFPWLTPLCPYLFWITAVLTGVSGLAYMRYWLGMFSQSGMHG